MNWILKKLDHKNNTILHPNFFHMINIITLFKCIATLTEYSFCCRTHLLNCTFWYIFLKMCHKCNMILDLDIFEHIYFLLIEFIVDLFSSSWKKETWIIYKNIMEVVIETKLLFCSIVIYLSWLQETEKVLANWYGSKFNKTWGGLFQMNNCF